MDPKLQYRHTFELRAIDDGAGVSGYLATFNRIDSYGTAVVPGLILQYTETSN